MPWCAGSTSRIRRTESEEGGPRATLLLTASALALSTVGGIALGIASATRRNSFLDRASAGVSLFGASMTVFWLGIVLMVIFALWLGWLPASGMSLGLGTQPPTADRGSMLATGRQLVILRPHVALLPGLAIFIVVVAINLVGDTVRDLLDPRVRAT